MTAPDLDAMRARDRLAVARLGDPDRDPLLRAEMDRRALLAEVERLREFNREAIEENRLWAARAEKAEAERDEAMTVMKRNAEKHRQAEARAGGWIADNARLTARAREAEDMHRRYRTAWKLAEAQVQAVRALADEWEHLADGPDETWPDEAHTLGTSVWHGPVFAVMLRAALDPKEKP